MNVQDRSKGIEPSEVLELCKDFLGTKWASVTEDNFDFRALTLFVCGVKDGTVDSVLVRYYGGNFLPQNAPMRMLTEAGEVLTFYCLSKCGLGPKLYGSFKGGRIEQFIPSTNFTMDQFWGDEKISEAIAKVLARFHAVDIPVKKSPFQAIKAMKDCMAVYSEKRDKLPPRPPPSSAEEAQEIAEILSLDILAEIAWIEKTSPLVQSRTVFAHNDLNRSNMLVRLDKGTDKPLDERLLLIDYEFNGYNHRGADIANHFTMRVFDFGSKAPFTGNPYPTEAMRRHFIESYLDECKKQSAFGEDWDENGSDSVEHVLMEEAFFCIVNLMVSITWQQRDMEIFSKMMEVIEKKSGDGKTKGGPASFIRFYKERKAEFLVRYPHFV